MGKLVYEIGNATEPCINHGTRVIIHIVNNVSAWDNDFTTEMGKKWKQPEMLYKQWFNQRAFLKGEEAFELGNIQKIALDVDRYAAKTYVINMLAQDAMMIDKRGEIPLNYGALDKCLQKVYDFCSEQRNKGIPITIHCPRLGEAVPEGDWDKTQKIIDKWLVHGENGFDTYVYALKHETENNKL